MIKTATHPTGQKIEFKEDTHTYMSDGVKYTSVTTLLKQWFPQFDEDRIAARTAQKRGITKEEILAEWRQTNNEACTLGTNVHLMCESILKGEEIPKPLNQKEQNYLDVVSKYIPRLTKKLEFIESEKIIFSPKYKIAGTVDLIFRLKNNIILMDWKTNKKLEFTNKYGEKGLRQLKHLDNCNFVKYSLQLHIYKKILEEENYFKNILKPVIIYINPPEINSYPVLDLQKEVKSMLNIAETESKMKDIINKY